jgi:hypothetical protein
MYFGWIEQELRYGLISVISMHLNYQAHKLHVSGFYFDSTRYMSRHYTNTSHMSCRKLGQKRIAVLNIKCVGTCLC